MWRKEVFTFTVDFFKFLFHDVVSPSAELAQLVERTTLNRVVVGSIPTFGVTVPSSLKHDRIR
jgi:hypothetical protein